MKITALVLAAGRSSRMGTNKLLLKVGGCRVLEHIINELTPIPTFVVTGHEANKITRLAESKGAQVVHNPNYLSGMTTSLQAGLSALDHSVEAVFMVLGDTFGFKHELLERMTEALQENPGKLLVSPVYQGRRGHPILFRRALFKELKNLKPEETIKTIIDRHEDNHIYVNSDIWAVTDLDTPADYDKVKKLWDANHT
jgi:molybdenum cofactor cytidylyltransferase